MHINTGNCWCYEFNGKTTFRFSDFVFDFVIEFNGYLYTKMYLSCICFHLGIIGIHIHVTENICDFSPMSECNFPDKIRLSEEKNFFPLNF